MELTAGQLEEKKTEIRKGNDLLRTTFFSFLGKVILTQGVATHHLRDEVLSLVREFSQFDGSNDPYSEHDFGAVEVESQEGRYCEKRARNFEKFFFKIDYYDPNLEYGADPLTEPFKRVITIMKASEY